MFEKKTLTVRNLKMTKLFYFGIAVVLFIASFLAYHAAEPGEALGTAILLNVIGLLLLIFGAAALGIGLCVFFLEKKGKVCPKCEKICQASEAMCPKCRTDITQAKSVKAYLLEKPAVTSSSPFGSDKSK